MLTVINLSPFKANKRLASQDESSPVISARETRATYTMLLIIGSFLICWIPLAANFITKLIAGKNGASGSTADGKLVDFFCYCAVHFNSAIDPLIYAYRIRDVRMAIRRSFGCKHVSTSVHDPSSLEMSVGRTGSKSASNEMEVNK